MATKPKPPLFCPSCGEEGSLVAQGNEYVCNDPECGRAFPIYPKYGLAGKPKPKPKSGATTIKPKKPK